MADLIQQMRAWRNSAQDTRDIRRVAKEILCKAYIPSLAQSNNIRKKYPTPIRTLMLFLYNTRERVQVAAGLR